MSSFGKVEGLNDASLLAIGAVAMGSMSVAPPENRSSPEGGAKLAGNVFWWTSWLAWLLVLLSSSLITEFCKSLTLKILCNIVRLFVRVTVGSSWTVEAEQPIGSFPCWLVFPLAFPFCLYGGVGRRIGWENMK